MFAGLVTLEEMKEKRETLVREREKQIAAKLPTNEVYGLSTMCHVIYLMLPRNRVPQQMSLEALILLRILINVELSWSCIFLVHVLTITQAVGILHHC